MATAHVFLKDLMKSKVASLAVFRGTVSVPSTSNMAIVFGFNGAISSRPNQKNLDDDDDDDDDAFSIVMSEDDPPGNGGEPRRRDQSQQRRRRQKNLSLSVPKEDSGEYRWWGRFFFFRLARRTLVFFFVFFFSLSLSLSLSLS